MHEQITIDGPAGSGKSTVAKELAKRISYSYISSGTFYRIVAYYLLKNNADVDNLDESSFWVETDGLIDLVNYKDNKVYLNNEDITDQLQTETIANVTSRLAILPFVRDYVNDIIVKIAYDQDIVVDGRDMGSVVFPNAIVKFYLTASDEVRAQRRYLQLQKTKQPANLNQIKSEIIKRDNQDKSRSIAPLKIPKKAVVIDTDNLSINDVVEKMYQYIVKFI